MEKIPGNIRNKFQEVLIEKKKFGNFATVFRQLRIFQKFEIYIFPINKMKQTNEQKQKHFIENYKNIRLKPSEKYYKLSVYFENLKMKESLQSM